MAPLLKSGAVNRTRGSVRHPGSRLFVASVLEAPPIIRDILEN